MHRVNIDVEAHCVRLQLPGPVYSGWHSAVPVHAHLQQLIELWTLKQMVFLPPLPLFIMLPTFVVQGQGGG